MHSTFEHRLGTGSKAAAFGFFVVLALTFFAFVGNAKAAIETAPPPQIWSDKADYAPGETVVLSGANWAPGDSVHIRVNDDGGQTWSRDVDVTADASGAISDQFNLPDWFVATYSVTATGAQSGTAVTSFTDGNVTVHLAAAEGVSSMTVTYDQYDGSTTCSGVATATNKTMVVASGGTTNIPGFGGSSDSVRFKSVSTPTAGKTFDKWTSGSQTTDSGTLLPGSPTPCITNNTGSGNIADLYGHFKNSNVAPVANTQSVSTNEDTAKTITLVGTDADGNSLTFADVSGPSNGTLGAIGAAICTGTVPKSCSADVVYTPALNYNGPDSFTFKVNDGTLDSANASVSITVNPVNDAPTCSNGSETTDEDTPVGLTLSCADVDNASLTYTIVSGPAHGDLTGLDASRTYTPDPDYNGSDSFTFKANDGTVDSNVATFSLTINAVNDAPTCSNGSETTDEDTPVGLTLSCADVDNASLTYTIVSGPAHGDLTGSGASPTYTPDPDYNGSDSFTFKANDGTVDSNVATFSLTINAVNDAPTANAQSVTTDEDTAKVVTLTGADVDGDTLSFKVTSLAANGKLYAGSGTGGHLIVTGDLPYTLAGNQVTYDPNLNYNGPDSFNFKANDGTVDSAAATVSITVTPVNDNPTVSADNATVTVNEGQTASNTGTYGDVDNDTVTLSASVGTVVEGSGGTWSWSFLTGDGPDQSQTVTITANDGNGGTTNTTFALAVGNIAPSASNGSFVFDPILGTATAGFDFSDVGFLDTHGPSLSFFTWSDVGNRFASVTEEHTAPNATGHASDMRTLVVGCYNLTVTGTAKDDDGGTSAALPIYSNSATSVHSPGFRPPIMDNERNIAKYGNVVPVKVTLTNSCTGATVTNVPLYITLAKGIGSEAIEDTNVIAESVSAADTGSQMRTADGMYIFNLSTKNLSANTDWTIRVRLGSTVGPVLLQAVLYPKK